LRQAAEALGIYIGAAINVGCLTNSSDKQYSYIAGSELNLFTAENECKTGETEPQQGHYTYSSCEFIANFAATNKGVMRNHNTVWGSYNPNVSFY
jgi:GH35 family endo-1,4-beta-xylanase